MASDDQSRDEALRALLVSRPESAASPRGRLHGLSPRGRQSAIVTAVVLVAVVAASIAALQIHGAGRAPVGDSPSTPTPASIPTPTLPAGPVLGRFTSADGPEQTHTIHPDGLALATLFTCTGKGHYLTSIKHWGEQGGDGRCDGGGVSSGNKGVAGSTTVRITTDARMTWTFTIVGIPETYVTPTPVPTPLDSAGRPVPYCTAADLTARFARTSMPTGVTEVAGGELVFTNRTAATCALAGYPEVRFVLDGTAIGRNTMNHVDSRDSIEHGLEAVVLEPGGHAYSQIDWYLPNYYTPNDEGACVARTVTHVAVDLHYDLAAASQTGTFDVPIGSVTACLNGAHGALGKYGQLSSTVFVDYSEASR